MAVSRTSRSNKRAGYAERISTLLTEPSDATESRAVTRPLSTPARTASCGNIAPGLLIALSSVIAAAGLTARGGSTAASGGGTPASTVVTAGTDTAGAAGVSARGALGYSGLGCADGRTRAVSVLGRPDLDAAAVALLDGRVSVMAGGAADFIGAGATGTAAV